MGLPSCFCCTYDIVRAVSPIYHGEGAVRGQGRPRYFPCETKRCPHIHGNWSGYCAECTRKSWLPPGSLKRLKIAGRKARLLFITLVMSFLETEDKVLLALFGGSITLACFFYCLAERQWAALVVLVVACAILALSIVGIPRRRTLSTPAHREGNRVQRLRARHRGGRQHRKEIREYGRGPRRGAGRHELGPAATVESDERQTHQAADPCSQSDAFLEICRTARSLKGAFD